MPPRSLLPYTAIGGLFVVIFGAAVAASFFQPKHTHAPTDRGLDSALYMKTSAEYRACCLQAYNVAAERVAAKVEAERKNPREGSRKPFAVVLDLDETVLDNGGFQADMVRARRANYDPYRWAEWEQDDHGRVGTVPGAKEFLAKLADWDVKPVFITNRSEGSREALHRLLKRLEIDLPDDRLLLLQGDKSDKTGRRKQAAEAFDVLLWVGDNLRDLDEAFKLDDEAFKSDKKRGIAGRKAAVDERRDKFGKDWIIIPNPAYGEWQKGVASTPVDVDLLK